MDYLIRVSFESEDRIHKEFAEKYHRYWRCFRCKFENKNLFQSCDGLVEMNVPYEELHPEVITFYCTLASIIGEGITLFPFDEELVAEYFFIKVVGSKLDSIDKDYSTPFDKLDIDTKNYFKGLVGVMKEAISCCSPPVIDIAKQLHHIWRKDFQQSKPGEQRIKTNKSDGTKGDINVPFDELHDDWKRENYIDALEAMLSVQLHPTSREKAAIYIHRAWYLRQHGYSKVHLNFTLQYACLSDGEKQKNLSRVDFVEKYLQYSSAFYTCLGDQTTIPFELAVAEAAASAVALHPDDTEAAAAYCHAEWMKLATRDAYNSSLFVQDAPLLTEGVKDRYEAHIRAIRSMVCSLYIN